MNNRRALQEQFEQLNRMTHRVSLRCTLPDGQIVDTHMDVALRDEEAETDRGREWADSLARRWLRNWTKVEAVGIRALAPEQQWVRGIDPDPARDTGAGA